jgi:hypothetical protein
MTIFCTETNLALLKHSLILYNVTINIVVQWLNSKINKINFIYFYFIFQLLNRLIDGNTNYDIYSDIYPICSNLPQTMQTGKYGKYKSAKHMHILLKINSPIYFKLCWSNIGLLKLKLHNIVHTFKSTNYAVILNT